MPNHTQKRYGDLLAETLSSEKRSVAFLLGAGCPQSIRSADGFSPLIPDIRGLTSQAVDKIATPSHKDLVLTMLENIASKQQNAATIEQLLTQLRLAQSFAGNVRPYDLPVEELANIERQLCREIVEIANKPLPQEVTPYHWLARWIHAGRRQHSINLFTTNYDTLLEQALERSRVAYFDGFTGAARPFFDIASIETDNLPAEWARLWKLHGSVTWHGSQHGPVYRSTERHESTRYLIYPSHLKYDQSRRMPYLAMMDRMRAFFRAPNPTLIVLGYSFGDEHINELIMDGLRLNPSAVAFALMYGDLEDYETGKGAALDSPNMLFLCRDRLIAGQQQMAWESDNSHSSYDKNGAPGGENAQFSLGNFLVFGEFLAEICGGRYTETSNV